MHQNCRSDTVLDCVLRSVKKCLARNECYQRHIDLSNSIAESCAGLQHVEACTVLICSSCTMQTSITATISCTLSVYRQAEDHTQHLAHIEPCSPARPLSQCPPTLNPISNEQLVIIWLLANDLPTCLCRALTQPYQQQGMGMEVLWGLMINAPLLNFSSATS